MKLNWYFQKGGVEVQCLTIFRSISYCSSIQDPYEIISLSDFLISRGQKVHVYCRRHAACDLPQVSVFFLLFSFFQHSTFLSFVHPTEVHIYCIITFVLRIMKKQSIGCMKPLQKKTGKI